MFYNKAVDRDPWLFFDPPALTVGSLQCQMLRDHWAKAINQLHFVSAGHFIHIFIACQSPASKDVMELLLLMLQP